MSILLVRSVGASSGNSVLWVVVYLYFRFNKTVDVICYGVIWLNTDLHNAIQYNTIQYNTIQYNTIQYNTIQYNTIQYNTIQYNAIQYNTAQHSTVDWLIVKFLYFSYHFTKYLITLRTLKLPICVSNRSFTYIHTFLAYYP